MKSYWLLFVVTFAVCSTCTGGLKLVNNGYENLYIVIHETVPENEILLDRIQEIFRDASALLYSATHKRAYFKTLKIIVPSSWTKKTSYKIMPPLSSGTSHILIGNRNALSPSTDGSQECGQEGKYIYLHHEAFVLKEGTTLWGDHDKVLVHEWGHFRWGLRDEYPTILKSSEKGGDDSLTIGSSNTVNFYQADGKWKPVGCSRDLNGFASTSCRYLDGNCDVNNVSFMIGNNCRFCPADNQPHNISLMGFQYIPSVVEFCDKDDVSVPYHLRHDSQAINEQNRDCDGRSAWEVMREHVDFKDGNNPPMSDDQPPTTDFQFWQATSESVRVFVLDTSGSMSGEKINTLYEVSKYIIEQLLPLGSWLSIIDFDSDAVVLFDFERIDSDQTRQKLVKDLPRIGSGGTCISCGLFKAMSVLRNRSEVFGDFDSIENAEIILISDGLDGSGSSLEEALQTCIDGGVVVHCITITEKADERLVTISNRTGGKLLDYTGKGSISLTSLFSDLITGGTSSGSPTTTTIINMHKTTQIGVPVIIDFSIDDGIGRNTTITSISLVTTNINTTLIGPDNFLQQQLETQVKTSSLVVPGVIEPGQYRAEVTSYVSANLEIIVTSKPVSSSAEVVRPVIKLSNKELDFTGSTLPKMFVFLKKGESPVKKAKVKAFIEDTQGHTTCELKLVDDGAGADTRPGDGVYTAELLRECQGGNGRHSSRVVITGTSETVVTNFIAPGSIIIDDETIETAEAPTGTFERVGVADAYTVSNFDPVIASTDITPPGRITDVQVIDIHSEIPSTTLTRNYTITWTATGNNSNVGRASFYEMRISSDQTVLRHNFPNAELLNVSGVSMTPKHSGSVERLVMVVSTNDDFTRTTYFAIRAIDDAGNKGPISNIIPITVGVASHFEVIEEECTDDCYAVVKDCGKSLTVTNGRVNLTNIQTIAGTTVPVHCDIGYELSGGTSIKCQENGTWSTDVTCEIVGCGGISITNGEVVLPHGTYFNATGFIKCSDGYHLKGVNATTCMANGVWNKTSSCEINDCGTSLTVVNGYVNFNGAITTYGETLPVTCDAGYEPINGPTTKCQANGEWESVTCDKIDCGDTSVVNGAAEFPAGTKYEDHAVINCHNGYQINGTGNITCLSSGLWSTGSNCVPKDCGTSITVLNGYVNLTGAITTYGETLSVICNAGYESRTGPTTKCQANGEWEPVTCDKIDCGDTLVINGAVLFSAGRKFQDTAVVNCHDGYQINGTGTITCLSSGLWSTDSNCVPKDCGTNLIVVNGYINFTGAITTYGETLPVACNTGYKPRNGPTTKCQANGEWESVTCDKIDCGDTSVIDGAAEFPAGTKYEDHAVINCHNGYQVNGTGTITCLSSGLWSTDSNCVPKDCGSDMVILNGYVNFTGGLTTFGEKIPVICNTGFEAKDGPTTKCQSDGTWESVVCEIIDCGDKSIVNGEAVFAAGTKFEAAAVVICDDGYRANGTGTIACLSTGIWSSDTDCVPKDCGTNFTLPHGFIDFTNAFTTFKQTLPVVCETGYKLIGGKSIKCEVDGEWKTTASCEQIDCKSTTIANGEVKHNSGTKYNDVATLSCDAGYEIEGSGFIVCLESAIWSNHSRCAIKDCGIPKGISNGHLNLTNTATTYGAIVPVTCDTGYKRIGGNSIVCRADGTWSHSVTCEIVGCGDASITNGQVRFPTGKEFGSRAVVTCSPGFHLTAENNAIVCRHNGVWNISVSCQINDCGRNISIPNGHVDFSNAPTTTFGQTIPVTCNKGYNLRGRSYIECRYDGTWAQSIGCEKLDCGRKTISNGEADFSKGTKYNDEAQLNCDIGFRATDPGFIICLDSGRWSTNSNCTIVDCGEEVNISNGHVNFTYADTTYGQTLPVACDTGYRGRNETAIKCLLDGSWKLSGSCEIIDCGKSVEIMNGQANFTSRESTYGQSVPIVCNAGFVLEGAETIACLGNGSWSNTPVCVGEGKPWKFKTVTIVATCFGLVFLSIIGLLTVSVIKHGRNRALREKHKLRAISKYKAAEDDVERNPDYNMGFEDWYTHAGKGFQEFSLYRNGHGFHEQSFKPGYLVRKY